MTVGLRDLELKGVYITDEDSIFDDFYKPALSCALTYDRAVGYFSSHMLAVALQGIGSLSLGMTTMRLVIGDDLDAEEYESVKAGAGLDSSSMLSERLQEILANPGDDLLRYRLEVLSLMIATGRLEIKYALRKKGIFHQKVGIIRDAKGDCVVFQGSANETSPGLLPSQNSETISVYPSWRSEIFDDYGAHHISSFERVWRGEYRDTITLDLPSSDYEALRSFRKQEVTIDSYQEKFLIEALFREKSLGPKIPDFINGKKYELRDHQVRALEGWMRNQYSGIMALATGAGKTITAIHGAVRVFEATKESLILVITVPYQILADQWCSELEKFNITAMRCWGGEQTWRSRVESSVLEMGFSVDKHLLALVVVNKTFFGEAFQGLLVSIPGNARLMFVADECHRVSSLSASSLLPGNAQLRLGLSATPWSKTQKDSGERLKSYFGPVVAKYTIDEALDDDVLCRYEYHPHTVYLTPDEEFEYESITGDIAKLMVSLGLEKPDFSDVRFQALFGRRARLLGSMSNKFDTLDKLAGSVSGGGILVYCGDGSSEGDDGEQLRDLTKAALILSGHGLAVSRITADESERERREIIRQFVAGRIDAVAAIRVLDEGFDLPYCREAFLLASGRNERQFIQRRGRVLRKSEGKDFAVIHDFICCPRPESSTPSLKKLVSDELRRAYEFARVASNREHGMGALYGLAGEYTIDFDLLIVDEEEENAKAYK